MEGRQFDRWTRTLAGRSRRDAIGVLAACLASGALALGSHGTTAQVDDEACGKKGDRCRNNSDCCNKFRCKNDKCREKNNDGNCGKDGDRCNNNSDCCNNFRCKNDKCRHKDKNNCGRNGDRCSNNGDCCNNFRCRNNRCRD